MQTIREKVMLSEIHAKINRLKQDLIPLNFESMENVDLQRIMYQIKGILGNFNNDLSFLACLKAKEFLQDKFTEIKFDAAAKAQGAPGLDIDIIVEGERLIAEIKTTTPYGENDFGSAQRDAFRKDFSKLKLATAKYKFIFVTERKTFEILSSKYKSEIAGIELVLLDS
jgi:hypothetical protein